MFRWSCAAILHTKFLYVPQHELFIQKIGFEIITVKIFVIRVRAVFMKYLTLYLWSLIKNYVVCEAKNLHE